MNNNIQKILIINKQHPHFNKAGRIHVDKNNKVTVKRILNKDMFKVDLDDGISCFVTKDDIKLI